MTNELHMKRLKTITTLIIKTFTVDRKYPHDILRLPRLKIKKNSSFLAQQVEMKFLSRKNVINIFRESRELKKVIIPAPIIIPTCHCRFDNIRCIEYFFLSMITACVLIL